MGVSIIKKISKIIGSRQASAYLELLITLCIIFCVIATLIYIPPAYSYKQDMDFMARKLVRVVEVTGTTDSIDGLYAQLSEQMSMAPTVTWDAAYISGTRNIQIRNTFTLTLKGSYEIKVFDPMFAPPAILEIPIIVTLTGVSEAYFK